MSHGAVLEYGDRNSDKGNFLSPRILSNVNLESRIMEEEIFGPIMPILFYKDFVNAVKIIRKNPNPLSLYYFGSNKSTLRKLINKVPAGGIVVNDVVVHFANTKMEFGGVRQSGLGKSHGYAGFKAFSNEVPVLRQPKHTAISLIYPPYNKLKKKIIDGIIKYL